MAFPPEKSPEARSRRRIGKKEWRSPLCRLDLISIYGAKIVDVR
jgi:hypothetical protein